MAENVDFAVHLGDSIYESQLNASWPSALRPVPTDLESYRIRHAVYRGDPQLRAAYQKVPWIVTWDDHEVLNGYWAMSDQAWIDRRNDAYQAFYEHMPIRSPAGPPGPSGFQVYRSLAYGDLLDLMLLDCRQYRDIPSCSRVQDPIGCPDPNMDDPGRTMLGNAQKQWLLNELSSSTADWRCIGSPLVMADVKLGNVVGYTDIWQGYAAERHDILDHVDSNNIDNVVVISGDWHRSIVSNLKLDFDDITTTEIATEFACPGITSTGAGDQDGLATFFQRLDYYPLNLHVRFWEGELQGYVVCDVTQQKWTSTYRTVDRTNPNATAQTLGVFEVDSGVPQANMVSGTGENSYPPNDA